MELLKIAPAESKLWDQVWRLYIDSFPDFERRRISSHSRACEDNQFHTCIAVENGNLLALFFFWKFDDYIYIEHLAVLPSLRGKNIGSTILTDFFSQNPGKKIILEIDPPVDEISIRRQAFYENLGFYANDFSFTHPSYAKNGHEHELKILSYPGAISEEEFEKFKEFMRDKVLAYID